MTVDIATPDKLAKIRELNDKLRTTFTGGVILLTDGVASLGSEVRAEVLNRIRNFDRFDNGNDPHAEHDFGSVKIGQQTFFWKVDYYDVKMQYHSPDPSDEKVTRRALTVMLAEEY